MANPQGLIVMLFGYQSVPVSWGLVYWNSLLLLCCKFYRLALVIGCGGDGFQDNWAAVSAYL